jgi:transposase-like protein
MAKDHRRVDAELVQEVLLDDPGFLREVVERAVQQILEAEMTEHVGALPLTSASRDALGSVTATSRGLCAPPGWAH